ncbi:MAG TPA: hypothetical protein VKU87_04385 [Thermomicrobiaceae bacterium]|nr:hypothetical protein [Thermomicrobiaceae bacterium]
MTQTSKLRRDGEINRATGEAHASARLTVQAVWDIRSSVPHGASIKGLARKYGVCPHSIRDVYQGKTWKWLYEDDPNVEIEGRLTAPGKVDE